MRRRQNRSRVCSRPQVENWHFWLCLRLQNPKELKYFGFYCFSLQFGEWAPWAAAVRAHKKNDRSFKRRIQFHIKKSEWYILVVVVVVVWKKNSKREFHTLELKRRFSPRTFSLFLFMLKRCCSFHSMSEEKNFYFNFVSAEVREIRSSICVCVFVCIVVATKRVESRAFDTKAMQFSSLRFISIW